jgi:hypothetical protein
MTAEAYNGMEGTYTYMNAKSSRQDSRRPEFQVLADAKSQARLKHVGG